MHLIPILALVTFPAFVAAVEKGHPEAALDALDAEHDRNAARRAGVLADPVLSFEREPEAEKLLLQQTFPWPGARGAEERAASAVADAADAGRAAGAAQRVYAAKRLFVRMVAAQRAVAVDQSALREAERMQALSAARYKQGVGSHMDALNAASSVLVVRANLENLRSELAGQAEEAAAAMGRPPGESVEFELAYPAAEGASAAAPPADPALAAIRAAGAAAAARADAGYRATLPQLSAGAMLMRDAGGMAGMARVGGMVALSLPVFSGAKRDSHDADTAHAAAQADARAAWHERQKAQAVARVARRLGRLAANLATLKHDIVPALAAHDASARAEYEQGRGTIAAVLESRAALLAARLGEEDAEAALHLAELARAAVAAGLVDAEADVPMPVLDMPAIGGGMGGMDGGLRGRRGGMDAMGEGGKRARKARRPAPDNQGQPPATTPADDAPLSAPGGGGMGM